MKQHLRSRTGSAIQALLMVLICLLSSPSIATASELVSKPSVKVLVLLSFHPFLPWTQSFISGLHKANMQKHRSFQQDNHIEFYIEHMDNLRLPGYTHEEWAKSLIKKYEGITFDGIIAESDPASYFAESFSRQYYPDTPMILLSSLTTKTQRHVKKIRINYNEAILDTLNLALNQNPSYSKIYIIDGGHRSGGIVIDALEPVLDIKSIPYKIIEYFSYSELKQIITDIPKGSIIFYSPVFKDNAGQQLIPKDVLRELSSISSAPIYTFWSSLLGTGTIGGHMIDSELIANEMVNALMDVFETGRYNAIYLTSQDKFDWNALKKHNISTSFDGQAVYINRPLPLLEAYFEEIMAIIFIAFSIMLLITLYWLKRISLINNQLESTNKQLAIEKNKADDLARIDPLSGIDNRRSFVEKGMQICNESRRLNIILTVIMIDIDFFKKINDTYGHAAGDLVIKNMANIIEQCKRDSDICARLGGEEFSIIAPSTDINNATALAERIRTECASNPVNSATGRINYTVSIGIYIHLPDHIEVDLDTLLRHADEALYKAKKNGRDRVEVLHREDISDAPGKTKNLT